MTKYELKKTIRVLRKQVREAEDVAAAQVRLIRIFRGDEKRYTHNDMRIADHAGTVVNSYEKKYGRIEGMPHD